MTAVEPVGARDYQLAVDIFGHAHVRPPGQPGTVGRDHGAGASWSYPAVKAPDPDTRVWFWRDTTDTTGRWLLAPSGLAATFTPDEEWKADCDHTHANPWQTCAFEADCLSLRREDARIWGDRS